MKTDENNTAAKAASNKKTGNVENAKQKKQVLMLSGLAVLLVAVLFIQFGGSTPKNEVAALAEITLDDAVSDAEAGGEVVAGAPVARENPVLLQSEKDDKLLRNAFSNFWDSASADEAPIVELTPPSIKLSGTMPGDGRAIAIIDGRIRFVGDTIDGWKLAEILPRAILLTGPGDASVVIDMPVIFGRVTVPAGLDLPGESSEQPSEDDLTGATSAEPDDG